MTTGYLTKRCGFRQSNYQLVCEKLYSLHAKSFNSSLEYSEVMMYYFVSPLCSYQAVAYIEASAVIYQDGKVFL
jgi:hypothetical protein